MRVHGYTGAGKRVYDRKSEFKYVYIFLVDNKPYYRAAITRSEFKYSAVFDTEREAAIAIDKLLLNKGYSAVNILKPKLNG